MLGRQLKAQEDGVHNVFTYGVGEEIACITRLMRIEASNKSLEIGGTGGRAQVAKKFR